jgi:hypothetical protein
MSTGVKSIGLICTRNRRRVLLYVQRCDKNARSYCQALDPPQRGMLTESRTTVSLSLKKCLIDKKHAVQINGMVDRVTWAASNIMWTLNLLVLKCLEYDIDPPPLERDLFHDIYKRFCLDKVIVRAPWTDSTALELDKARAAKVRQVEDEADMNAGLPKRKRKRGHTLSRVELDAVHLTAEEAAEAQARARRKAPTDYTSLELDKARDTKIRKGEDEDDKSAGLPKRKRERGQRSSRVMLDAVQLTEKEVAGAQKLADKSEMLRIGKETAKVSWKPILELVICDLEGLHLSSWRPEGPLKGESDQVETLIHSQLVPNSITYVKETYRARRRVHLQTGISRFFKTKSHVSRVATRLIEEVDTRGAIYTPDGQIDWTPVFGRVRTHTLLASFKNEMRDALSAGLEAHCTNLIRGLLQDLPASVKNLETQPHRFLRSLHVMQVARESANGLIMDAEDESDSEEEDDATEDFQAVDDRPSLQKQFTLLPLKSGRAVFISLDPKRATSMKCFPLADISLGLKWYDGFLDPTRGIRGQSKQGSIMPNFQTDGVQLKVFLTREKVPADGLLEKGYARISARTTDSLRNEATGVYILENTSPGIGPYREIVGLDPGVRDVYTSVQSGCRRSRSVSNRQWSQLQRSKLIRRKDYRWKREVLGLTSVLQQMGETHTKSSAYCNLLKAVKLRLTSKKTLWEYQMRRNRRVYRFSSLLARNSALDRMSDAIVQHRPVSKRQRGRWKHGHREGHNAMNPIIAFGGGQFRSGGSGLMSVPRKAIIKRLSHRTAVVIVDEYKTSQMCSDCGNKLTDPDQRHRSKDGSPHGAVQPYTKKDKTRLRRCQSDACAIHSNEGVSTGLVRHRHWNRDVNAAINMLSVAVKWLDEQERPSQLRRPESTNQMQDTELVQPYSGIILCAVGENP